MQHFLERLRAQSQFPPALIIPSVIMVVFAFFSLSAAPDPTRISSALQLGIVNLDAGAAPLPIKIGDKLVEGLTQSAPIPTLAFSGEENARAALEDGTVTALLIIPEEFTANVAQRQPVDIKIITSQHLSALESQFGSAIPTQLQLGINAALNGITQNLGGQAAPRVIADIEVLHASPNGASTLAPVIVTSAMWISSMVGALMLFLASSGAAKETPGNTTRSLAIVRSILPVVTTFIASSILSLIVSWATQNWAAFLPLFAIFWMGTYTLTMLCAGIFSIIGLWGLALILPMVFYQPILSGAQLPLQAGPDWLAGWAGNLPFGDLPQALRAELIGGPVGTFWSNAPLVAILGLALIWAGIYGWSMIQTNAKTSTA